jgi:tetratricopeptide (TPR) repeat protein
MRAIAAFANDVAFQAGNRSIAEARKAVTIEPDYALGHATLASTLGHYYMGGGGKEPAMAREGLAHAERALVLAPNDPKVLAQVAIAMGYCGGSWRAALTYAQRAVDLSPNSATGRAALGMLLVRFKKPDDAIMHLHTVESLTPRGPLNYGYVGVRGLAHFQAGRYEEALQAAEQSLLDHPDFMYALKDRVIYLEKLGRQEEAREAVRRLRSTNRGITLDDVETANMASFIPPEMATDMNATFRKVWLETPLEIPGA